MSTDLDPFETALLSRLRDVVSQNAARTTDLARPPRRRRHATVLGAAAVTVAAVLLPGLLTQPAYSVQEGNRGEVSVNVHRLDDAAGLEKALRAHGVPADVTFLPPGMQCAPGRYTRAEDRRGLSISIGRDSFAVTLASGTVRPGDTFVVAAAVQPLEHGVAAWVSAEVATGPVQPCTPIPAIP